MDVQSAVIVMTLILVLIVIPALIAKKAGKTPAEYFFPGRTGQARGPAGGRSKTGQAQGAAGGGTKTGQGQQTNSTRDDLLKMVSGLARFSRKRKLVLIFPGTLEVDGEVEPLTAILVTKTGVIGINGFGYGGTVEARSGQESWAQTLNGVRKEIPGPPAKNAQKLAHLRRALDKAGFQSTPAVMMGVFTSPRVDLKYAAKTHCYTTERLMEELSQPRWSGEGSVDVKAVGKALEKQMYREPKK